MASRRGALTRSEVEVRVADLLANDATCKGQVDKRTVRAIAEVVAYPEPVLDRDLEAERAGCRHRLAAVLARCDVLLADDPDDLGLITAGEVRELRTMIAAQDDMLRQGLHRTAGDA